jgi:putative transposase
VELVVAKHGVSERLGCRVLGQHRSTQRKKPTRPDDEVALTADITSLATQYGQYGYRRGHILLKREGWKVNPKRVYRLYKEMGFQLRNNVPKRRVKAKLRDDRKDAVQINETWAIDFVHHQWATGTKIRILTIVDTFSRFSPIVDPRLSYRGEDVVQTLERVCKSVGYPKTILVDQGSEFISRDLDLWAYHKGVILEMDAPRPPSALSSR